MAFSYDARMKEALLELKSARVRLDCASQATSSLVKRKVADVKCQLHGVQEQYSPERLISKNPWKSTLAALLAGTAATSLGVLWIARSKRKAAAAQQRVVVEVVHTDGTSVVKEAEEIKAAKPGLLEVLAQNLPEILEKAQKLVKEFKGTANGNSVVEPTQAHAANGFATNSKPSDPAYAKTASRKTTPPPDDI